MAGDLLTTEIDVDGAVTVHSTGFSTGRESEHGPALEGVEAAGASGSRRMKGVGFTVGSAALGSADGAAKGTPRRGDGGQVTRLHWQPEVASA